MKCWSFPAEWPSWYLLLGSCCCRLSPRTRTCSGFSFLTAVFAIFAASWDLLSGFTGQINFGHALFFGVAAYTSGLINVHAKLPHILTIPLGALAAVLTGLIVGIPCLRLRGTYLALTTLAFPIILMGLVFAIPDVTGGELGVSGLSRLSGSRVHDYYITVILMLGLTSIMWKITDSKTGIILACNSRG